jgi:AbiU2
MTKAPPERRPSPLTKTQDLYSREAIVALVKTIANDLSVAVANYEMFAPSANDQSLFDRVNEGSIGWGFNVVSEALQLNVLSALCRIWDDTKGAAGIPLLRKRLPKLRGLAIDPNLHRVWLKYVETVEGWEVFRAIRGFRHVGLAHRHDPGKLDPRALSGERRVQHGDEREFLEATIGAVEVLYDLLDLKDRQDLMKRREEWRGHSERFWNAIQ